MMCINMLLVVAKSTIDSTAVCEVPVVECVLFIYRYIGGPYVATSTCYATSTCARTVRYCRSGTTTNAYRLPVLVAAQLAPA